MKFYDVMWRIAIEDDYFVAEPFIENKATGDATFLDINNDKQKKKRTENYKKGITPQQIRIIDHTQALSYMLTNTKVKELPIQLTKNITYEQGKAKLDVFVASNFCNTNIKDLDLIKISKLIKRGLEIEKEQEESNLKSYAKHNMNYFKIKNSGLRFEEINWVFGKKEDSYIAEPFIEKKDGKREFLNTSFDNNLDDIENLTIKNSFDTLNFYICNTPFVHLLPTLKELAQDCQNPFFDFDTKSLNRFLNKPIVNEDFISYKERLTTIYKKSIHQNNFKGLVNNIKNKFNKNKKLDIEDKPMIEDSVLPDNFKNSSDMEK